MSRLEKRAKKRNDLNPREVHVARFWQASAISDGLSRKSSDFSAILELFNRVDIVIDGKVKKSKKKDAREQLMEKKGVLDIFLKENNLNLDLNLFREVFKFGKYLRRFEINNGIIKDLLSTDFKQGISMLDQQSRSCFNLNVGLEVYQKLAPRINALLQSVEDLKKS